MTTETPDPDNLKAASYEQLVEILYGAKEIVRQRNAQREIVDRLTGELTEHQAIVLCRIDGPTPMEGAWHQKMLDELDSYCVPLVRRRGSLVVTTTIGHLVAERLR